MEISKSKATASLIALFLILTIAASLVALPVANAREYYYNSYVYVASNVKLLGVGQQVVIVMWTADMPPDIGEIAGEVDSPTGRAAWYNVQIKVTKPDNTTETFTIPLYRSSWWRVHYIHA